jgi:protein-arginine kinase activator protein McsA
VKILISESQLKKLKKSVKKVHCQKCGWEWDLSDGGKDPYTCHKCGNKHAELKEEDEKTNKRKTLNFFDLVSKRIVWITEPHTNGKRDKQNWEHDTNVITLWNVEHPEPGQEWVRQAIHFPKNNSVKWWNDIGQFKLTDDKYNQILRSIELYKKKNEKDKDAKFLTCGNCRSKFTQTTHKGKKSLPICPTCGTHNK